MDYPASISFFILNFSRPGTQHLGLLVGKLLGYFIVDVVITKIAVFNKAPLVSVPPKRSNRLVDSTSFMRSVTCAFANMEEAISKENYFLIGLF